VPEKPPRPIKILSSLPLNLLLNGVLIIPFIIMIYLALVRWSPLVGVNWWNAPFGGVVNFQRALSDSRFIEALGRTALFVAIVVPLELLIGLLLAYILQKPFRGKRFVISLLIYPLMLPPVVVATVFYLFFQPYGPVNNIFLQYVIGPRALNIYWFLDPTLAFITIIVADTWQWTPFMFLIMYSGLSAVPKRLIEAAEVLGASEWTIFWKVRLPLIKPLISVAVILRSLEAFKVFDYVYVMTGGGPGTSTESISLYIYRLAILYSDISYAAAVSLIVLAIIFIVSYFAVKILVGRR